MIVYYDEEKYSIKLYHDFVKGKLVGLTEVIPIDELLEVWERNKANTPQTDAEIPKNVLRSDCTGCRFIGTYDTEFPCVNCVRKNKDYYDSEYTEGGK